MSSAAVTVCPVNVTISTSNIRAYGTVLYVFGFIFTIFNYCSILWAQRGFRFARLSSRHPLLSHIMCAGAFLHLQIDPLALMIGRENYKCAAVLLDFLIIPLLGGPVVARLLSFYYRSRFESQAISNFRASLRAQDDERKSDLDEDQNRRLTVRGVLRAFRVGFWDAFLCRVTEKDLNLRALRYLQSGYGISFVVFVVFLMPALLAAISVAAAIPTVFHGCAGCQTPDAVTVFVLVQGSIIASMTFLLILRIRAERLPDKWGVVPETLVSLVFSAMGMAGFALLNFVFVSPFWDFTMFLSIGIWGLLFTQTGAQVYLAVYVDQTKPIRSRKMRALKSSISSSSVNAGHFNLNVVLADKILAKAFEEHLQREFGIESLFFYREALAWKTVFSEKSMVTRASRARKIINTFIRSDGIFSVNIASSTSRTIIESLQDSNFPDYELFDDALDEVRELLEMGALARFKNSSTFRNLITENLQHLEPFIF